MMDAMLLLLVSFGNLLLAVIIAERGLILWQQISHRITRPGETEADHNELRAYTHASVHELRGRLHEERLHLETKTAVITERIGRLEAKMDVTYAAQTETLDRILKLIEAQIPKMAE